MGFIRNISSVARYESKVLLRSWFFKVFTVLALAILTLLNVVFLVSDQAVFMWVIRAVPSNIPYFNLLLLNTGQAVIAIFLSSEFLKRDKKLDTSEVFYTRPLSNAEYVLGKIAGNLKVFFALDGVIIFIALLFNFIAKNAAIDWGAYIIYFFLICIPTLVFITGLSVFLMSVLKNQALTFVLLLGYIGLTLFYLTDKFYYLFDYMAYHLPLFKSSIVGFTQVDTLLIHRGIYFFLGAGFLFFTIFLFKRLPNSARNTYPWLGVSGGMFITGVFLVYMHIRTFKEESSLRQQYIELNNRYVHAPKMAVNVYDLSFRQEPESVVVQAEMEGVALESSRQFTFSLNPGLRIQNIRSGNKELEYVRERQIIRIDFGYAIEKGDTARLCIRYHGKIDESFCYLDIPENVREEKNWNFLFNIDKKYSFQTPRYLLVTPETYWYPRPGTAYSDKSPAWQQTYFSRFRLHVEPLPGLVPISQGKGRKNTDGSYTFVSDIPYQAVSLIIGNYKKISTQGPDGTSYNLFYIDGHDYFTALYDSIADTIPALIQNVRESIESTYGLSYPFNRFSLVESPGQLYSYPRTWTQAEEVVQPELVLFPEKGMSCNEANIGERQQKQIEWSRWGGNEIDRKEGLIRATADFFQLFIRKQGDYNYSMGNRGRNTLSIQANPYFLFPELYNFRYSIFSPQWPVANRVVELYLQKNSDTNEWEREINGLSNNEKANLLMGKRPFNELLADVTLRGLTDNLAALKGKALFAPAELQIGNISFADSLSSVLKRNTFRNIRFESLLDTLSRIGHTDLNALLADWNRPVSLPVYSIERKEVIRIVNREKEIYQVNLLIYNCSDSDGIINVEMLFNRKVSNDPRTNRKIRLNAREAKRLVSYWEEAPREIHIHTLISGNLPNHIKLPVENIRKELNYPLQPEGEYSVTEQSFRNENEIIVDNEDSLFFLSIPGKTGLLPKLLDKVADSTFRYSGVAWWRPPVQWTATTNAGYYGKSVRSAYVVKSGNGEQTATWKVPLKEKGAYEIYYHVYRDNEVRNKRGNEAEYHFKIKYDNETDDAILNLQTSRDEWEQLGVYYFDTDTVSVILTNKCRLRNVTADAVKFIKR